MCCGSVGDFFVEVVEVAVLVVVAVMVLLGLVEEWL